MDRATNAQTAVRLAVLDRAGERALLFELGGGGGGGGIGGGSGAARGAAGSCFDGRQRRSRRPLLCLL
jgi:hypothetical protein